MTKPTIEELKEIAHDMGLDEIEDIPEEELFKRLDNLYKAQTDDEYDSFEDLLYPNAETGREY